jgi:hypothetical protein
LFEDSKYILRTSGERWADEARLAGVRTGCDLIVRGFNMDADPPFQHLVARLKRHEAEGVTPADLARLSDRMEAAGAFAAMQAGDIEKAARIVAEFHREETGKVTGARILAAGRRARMDGSNERPLPPKDSLAAQIIAAGKKRRNEV